MLVIQNDAGNEFLWDEYVKRHSQATHCHLYGWKKIIEETYNLKGFYLYAVDNDQVAGVLPLFYIKSYLFGNQLVSMPFLNYGGILADTDQIANLIHIKVLEISKVLNSPILEYRCTESGLFNFLLHMKSQINKNKVRMVLPLPKGGQSLFQSFNAKLRNQIRRPTKEGMTCTIGDESLLKDFYQVFSRNMRDLGSPVHSILFFKNIIKYLKQSIKIGVVYYQKEPIATGLIICFRNLVEIPWASTIKKFNNFSPNMLLYWSFLEYACDNGFEYFDFGRSSMDEGTFRFKQQWGAEPRQLYWYQLSPKQHNNFRHSLDKKSIPRQLVASVWSKLPLIFANYLGPKIRYKISL